MGPTTILLLTLALAASTYGYYCPEPPAVPHATYTLSGSQYDHLLDTATYTCVSGYKATGGSAVRFCNRYRNGRNWQASRGSFLICSPIQKDCSVPDELSYTTYTKVSTESTYHILYACAPGYEYGSGSYKKHCNTKTGSWMMNGYSPLMCKQIIVGPQCPPAPEGENVKLSFTGTGAAQWAKYICIKGYVWKSGQSSIDCENGKWATYNALKCQRLTFPCPSPPYSQYAVAIVTGTSNDMKVVRYSCPEGYTANGGSETINCNYGRWESYDALRCSKAAYH